MEPLSEEEIAKGTELNPVHRTKTNCTVFLGYTSNLISSGLRENIRFLAQHNLVSCLCLFCPHLVPWFSLFESTDTVMH